MTALWRYLQRKVFGVYWSDTHGGGWRTVGVAYDPLSGMSPAQWIRLGPV